MSYRQRIHVAGGTYHVVQRGSKVRPIFTQPDDYALFESVLQGALRSTGARLHAYCWSAEAVYLAVQIDEISLGHFMQWLKSRYARGVQRRLEERGHLFQVRYDAVIIDPTVYLPRLIHYIHYVPVLRGWASSPDDYAYTSHRAYRDGVSVPWLHCNTTRRMIDARSEDKQNYNRLMSEAPTPEVVRLFQRGMPDTPGILGGPEFAKSLGYRPPRGSRMTPDQIIRHVCCLLDVTRDDVLSKSRLRRLALARAVIAWHATVRGITTLAEISRYLNRVSSTLSKTICSYRKRRPEFFKLDAFTHLVPIGPNNLGLAGDDEEDVEAEEIDEEIDEYSDDTEVAEVAPALARHPTGLEPSEKNNNRCSETRRRSPGMRSTLR